MNSLVKLIDDQERYKKGFEVYHRLADRGNVFKRWVDTEFRGIIQALDVGVGDRAATKFLSIGPGDGSLEENILGVLRHQRQPYIPIHTTVVEPAPYMVERFKQRVASGGLSDVTYDWRTQTLEEYQATPSNQDAKFNFISSLHSIYYVPDLRASLQYLYERLEPNGIMLIILSSDKSGFAQVRLPHLPNDQVQVHYPTSAEIRTACADCGIPIATDVDIKIRGSIRGCLGDPPAMAEDGLLMLDFVTHVANFARDAPADLLQRVQKSLGGDLCSEKDGDGVGLNFKGDWCALIITRQ